MLIVLLVMQPLVYGTLSGSFSTYNKKYISINKTVLVIII